MMATGGTQQSLRNVLGALKDSTTVGLAKVNSEFKDLDVAIVRASNHVEKPAKEKHIQAIFMAVSASRPRDDVAYCIHALARRLHKTRNWAVALKTLIVIHRALREVDLTFCEELIIYSRRRGHVLNMAHFKDDSGPQAWDYSAWVRSYALFLEERLECFRVLKYDINRERLRTKDVEAVELLEQLPALQQLLSRLLSCQPQGAASYNFVIQLALTMVAGESIKIYNAISDGTINLVDKFFEMPHAHAVKAIEIYRRSGSQAESLSKFYDMCKSLNLGRGEKYMKVDQPPASFLTAMEDYVREIPRTSSVRRNSEADKLEAPKVILAIEYKTEPEVQEAPAEVPAPVEEPVEVVEEPKSETVDLLGLKEESPEAAALYEKNALALAIVPVEVTKSPQMTTSTTGWELALVTTPSDNTSALVESKLAGGLDKLTLDSLYEDAMSRKGNQSYGSSAPNPFESQTLDPFYASTAIAPPQAVQMASLAQQQQTFMWQQQQHQMMILSHHQQQSMNPFGNPYGGMGLGANPYGVGMPVQASYSSYGGLI